jgi:lysophospholipase L1-like esterase
VDATIAGGFLHTGLLPLTAGVPFYFRGYYPMGIVGQPHPSFTGTEIVPFFLGDSINIQYIDCGGAVKGVYDPLATRGWNGRFCATTYPYIIYGQGGGASNGFIGEIGKPTFNYILGSATSARKVTHAVNEYGINSIRLCKPASTVQAMEWADRQKVGAIFARLKIPYIQTTLTPCEQSLTVWTKDDASFATFVSQRQALNQQIKAESDNAHIPGCVGYIDANIVLETDPVAASNLWVKAYRTDGIHPNSAGHDAWAHTPAIHKQMNDLFVNNPNPIPK